MLPRHWRAALLLNLVMLIASVAIFAVPVMAPALARTLGVDTSLLGAWSAILWASSLVTVIGAGHLIARHGALRVSQFCLAFCVAGLACAMSGWLPGLALASILIGLGQGLETPASSALLARLAPPARQPIVFAVKQTGVQLGGIAAGLMYPLLLLAMSWRSALLITIGLTLLIIALVSQVRDSLEPPSPPSGSQFGMRQALRLVWRDRRLLRLTFASFAYISMQVSANTFLVTWMVQDLGRSLVQAGLAFAALQIGGFAGRLLWGLICGPRLRPHTVLVFLGIGMAVCALALWLATPAISNGLLITLGLATGLTVAGWNALFLAEVARLSPAGEVGRVTSASFLFGSIGLVLGPVFFSLIAAASRYGTAFLVMGAIALTGVIVLLGERAGGRARPL